MKALKHHHGGPNEDHRQDSRPRPIDRVWDAWNNPEDIKQWNAPHESWHTTHSIVDLREGGKFLSRMEAKDGSAGFDFEGTYTRVQPHQAISYRMTDAREVDVDFVDLPDGVLVRSTFDAETENSEELQRGGWQAISDNFGRHVERRVADLGEVRAALGPF